MEVNSQTNKRNIMVSEESFTKRDGFGSRIGIIAAAAGSAIGLGNIWRFPYIAGQNGGGAFILVYLVFVVGLGMTGMLAEVVIGRRAQRNVVNSFWTLAPRTPWFLAGILGIVTVSLILAYYIVIFGWTFDYVIKSVLNEFAGKTPGQIYAIYQASTSGVFKPILYPMFTTKLS